MAILYDFYVTPSHDKGEQKVTKFHARVVGGQTVETDALVQRISERSTLGRGDILSLFSELSYELSQDLLAGNRVHIPGIGFFYLSLHAPKEASPTTTRAQHISVKHIEFRAAVGLRQRVENGAVFERCREKVHSVPITNEQIDELLLAYFKDNAYITCRKFSILCRLTKGTALHHLHRLVEEGKLVNTNTPRNPIYMLDSSKFQSSADEESGEETKSSQKPALDDQYGQ